MRALRIAKTFAEQPLERRMVSQSEARHTGKASPVRNGPGPSHLPNSLPKFLFNRPQSWPGPNRYRRPLIRQSLICDSPVEGEKIHRESNLEGVVTSKTNAQEFTAPTCPSQASA